MPCHSTGPKPHMDCFTHSTVCRVWPIPICATNVHVALLTNRFPSICFWRQIGSIAWTSPYLEVQHATIWLHGNCTDSLQNEELKPCEWWCPHSTIPSGLSTQFANQPASKLEVSKLQHHDNLWNKHQKTPLLYSCQYSRSKPYLIPESFHEASRYDLQIKEMQILFYGQHSMLKIKHQTSLQNV